MAQVPAAPPAKPVPEAAPSPPKPANRDRILKAVKWDMISGCDTVLQRFERCKELDFNGMELVSPAKIKAEDVHAASLATGLPVHGLVNLKHWDIRLSSPDPNQRSEGARILEQAIRDCHAFGGHSVLLVPGRVTGKDETHDDVWNRSIAAIKPILPLASQLGVRVLIENVWNGFCETPEQFRDYIDQFASPWLGAYLDLGNCRKFGPTENWIRVLGSRIVKLDIKDWSTRNGFGVEIGDGEVNWPKVREALAEVGYSGWVTAEVTGGGRDRLAFIAKRMNRVLAL